MKKIALLLTILSVGALNGMEKPNEYNPDMWKNLPGELLSQITPTEQDFMMGIVENSGNNLGLFIQKITRYPDLVFVNKKLYQLVMENLAGFTLFVHMLANKYDMTTKEVAQLFNTPVAAEYIALGEQLIDKIKNAPQGIMYKGRKALDGIIDLIYDGADVNYTTTQTEQSTENQCDPEMTSATTKFQLMSPLIAAMKTGYAVIVETLINAGAKVDSDAYYDAINAWPMYDTYKKSIKPSLDEARKRQ